MSYKLKHLAKYCCKPANKLEFEAVKMAGKLEGLQNFMLPTLYISKRVNKLFVSVEDDCLHSFQLCNEKQLIPVLDFIKKLRMTEEEAEKLEDDRVELSNLGEVLWTFTNGKKSMIARSGYRWKTN